MKNLSELLKQEKISVTYKEDGQEKTDEYIISKIPALQAESILLSATTAFQERNFRNLPMQVTMEMMKYVAHNGIVLDSEVMVNTHVPDLGVLITIQVKMAEKNFGFLGEERFQEQLEALRKLLG